MTSKDIDSKNKILHIRGTKTKLSDRYIPLFENVEKLLKNICNRNAKAFKFNSDYVSKGLEKLGLSFELNLKDLRTTFATRCAESGISNIVIAKWLGYSSTYITKKHYEKVLDEFENSQAQKIAQAFLSNE